MNCAASKALLTLYVLKDLDASTEATVRTHLETCPDCRAALQEIESTLGLLRDALAAPTHISAQLGSAQRARVLEPRASQGPIVVSGLSWFTQHHRALAAAAAAVVVVGVIALIMPATQSARRVALGVDVMMEESLSELDEVDYFAQDKGRSERESPVEEDFEKLAFGEAPEARYKSSLAPKKKPSRSFFRQRSGESGVEVSAAAGRSVRVVSAPVLKPTPPPVEPAPVIPAPVTAPAHTEHAWFVDSDSPDSASPVGGKPSVAKPSSPAAMPVLRPASEVSRLSSATEFDSVTMTKSPMIVSGALANRTAGRREAALRTYGGGSEAAGDSDGDDAVGMDVYYATPSVKELGDQVVPILGDAPMIGRKFKGKDVGGEAGEADPFADVESIEAVTSYDYLARTGETIELEEGKSASVRGQSVVAGPDALLLGKLVKEEQVTDLRSGLKRDEKRRFDLSEKMEREADLGQDLKRFEKRDRLLEVLREEEPADEGELRWRFTAYGVNPFVVTRKEAFSTFGIDVDTASYTLTRSMMRQGALPPAEAVRTEEFVNAFDYDHVAPTHRTFRIYTELAPSPFGRGLQMLKIGVKGRRVGREEQRPAVLTFLVDTSGSMNAPERLGLVQKSLRLLVENLGPHDQVAVIQYDSHARLLLEHTPASHKDVILKAINRMQCSGSTNLEEGMNEAYRLAAEAFIGGAENRVLLLSDGVANLGSIAAEDILNKVAAYRKQGIFCSVFGVGSGSYDDTMLETLANKGDGVYTFLDSEEQARRVFVDDLAATLNTIASDVKIQVEFNPNIVRRYRQLGYENRRLKKEDFRNDAVDAGEVGSGQSVTALYELDLLPMLLAKTRIELPPRRLATVRVRYRRIDTGRVEEIERAVWPHECLPVFEKASNGFRLAATVAEFAEILRGSPHARGSRYKDVTDVLRPVALELHLDKRVQELLQMVTAAESTPRGQ
ncbi:MAG: von Willebrand factor type A domain-containing protein [Kiritimatiellae bacterium]|nr:von Willebrand factor type A domain-containing protein [Kiritimatiellia bacterium]